VALRWLKAPAADLRHDALSYCRKEAHVIRIFNHYVPRMLLLLELGVLLAAASVAALPAGAWLPAPAFALGYALFSVALPIVRGFACLLGAAGVAICLLEDGSPVIYRQERVGLNGRPFPLLKFRSMRRDAERGYFLARLSRAIACYDVWHSIKQGITGLAQLCYQYGASAEDVRHKLLFGKGSR